MTNLKKLKTINEKIKFIETINEEILDLAFKGLAKFRKGVSITGKDKCLEILDDFLKAKTPKKRIEYLKSKTDKDLEQLFKCLGD